MQTNMDSLEPFFKSVLSLQELKAPGGESMSRE